MGIGRTNTGGGGGGGLNFKVACQPSAPNNPKENTIWVKTDTEIKDWVFSAEAPTDTHVVWFETGEMSNATLNALKKNGIVLELVNARRFIDGEWVPQDWSIFQNGAWAEFEGRLYLYNNGNMCEAVSGGWERKSYNNNPGAITWGDDYIYFPGTTSTVLINPKNFDESLIGKYKTLNAEVEVLKITDSSNPYFSLGLAKNYTFTANVGSQWDARTSVSEVGTHTLSLPLDGFDTGKPMIGVFHMNANLKAVWLE